MKKQFGVLAFALVAVSASASAQQADKFAAGLATAMEAMGQSVGESASAGPSVFVTATGRAPLNTPSSAWYLATIEERAPTASEAARLRDDRLSALEAQARRFAVTTEVTSSAFSVESGANGQAHPRPMTVTPGVATPGAPPPLNIAPVAPPAGPAAPTPPRRGFIARAAVRFRATDPQRLPSFLDALQSAGIDNITGGPAAANASNLFQNNEVFGVGVMDKVDDATWDRAGEAAIAEARRQASVLSAAAGRTLGETREIIALTRGVQANEATVTLAVRFGFAPAK